MARKFVPANTGILTCNKGLTDSELLVLFDYARQRRGDGSVIYTSLSRFCGRLISGRIQANRVAAVICDTGFSSKSQVIAYAQKHMLKVQEVTEDSIRRYSLLIAEMWDKDILVFPREYGYALASTEICKEQGYPYPPTFEWRHSPLDLPLVADEVFFRKAA